MLSVGCSDALHMPQNKTLALPSDGVKMEQLSLISEVVVMFSRA